MSAPARIVTANDLIDEFVGSPEYIARMVEACIMSHRFEEARQQRIASGQEHVCVVCGCSETRACAEGCCWATETHCSRCV